MSNWIYERNDNLFTPGTWAGGPWSPVFQHGGPVAGLFAMIAEEAAVEDGLQLVRLTTELFRTVPIAPLTLETRYVRRGYRIAGLEMNLRAPGETEITARATALLMRASENTPPSWETHEQSLPHPDSLSQSPFIPKDIAAQMPPGFHLSVESCIGSDEHSSFAWLKTPLDLVAGVPGTPLQRFTALADISFGLSTRLRVEFDAPERPPQPMINADASVYWERAPVGEWMGFRSLLLADRAGIGISDVALYDVEGRFGRCLQAAMLNPRPRKA